MTVIVFMSVVVITPVIVISLFPGNLSVQSDKVVIYFRNLRTLFVGKVKRLPQDLQNLSPMAEICVENLEIIVETDRIKTVCKGS